MDPTEETASLTAQLLLSGGMTYSSAVCVPTARIVQKTPFLRLRLQSHYIAMAVEQLPILRSSISNGSSCLNIHE